MVFAVGAGREPRSSQSCDRGKDIVTDVIDMIQYGNQTTVNPLENIGQQNLKKNNAKTPLCSLTWHQAMEHDIMQIQALVFFVFGSFIAGGRPFF